jgi:23S rRNA (uracil1939-C5)-methyltransferase
MTQIHINGFHTDGSGITKKDDYTYHIWNGLPGEDVEIEISKKKRRHVEALATKILTPSPVRIEPVEKDFVSSSPWQIIELETELLFKHNITTEVFKELPDIIELFAKEKVFTDNTRVQYRHKMEYHIYTDEENNFHLGIFGRTEKKKIPIPPSILATDALNLTASKIIAWLDEVKFPRPLLKTIIVRSNTKGETVAGLFVKTHEIEKLQTNPFDNLTIYYSEPKSPASVATELLVEAKKHTLTQSLLGMPFTYGLMSFFQINPSVFEATLRDIEQFIEAGSSVVDFYSGVGTIGLSLRNIAKDIVLVEENSDAVTFAKQNIENNNIQNAQAFLGQAHTLREYINAESILIVDPPRGGLHPKVIKKIIETLPPKLIYLSCNIESQARDLQDILPYYKPVFAKLYNYFPMTPHVESLIVLEKN